MQTLQAVVPKPFVLCDPFSYGAEPFGDEVISSFTAMTLLGDETRIEQDTQMLRDRRAAHLKVPGNRVDRAIFHRQQIKHVPPRRMADRRENIRPTFECCYHATSIGKQVLTCQV